MWHWYVTYRFGRQAPLTPRSGVKGSTLKHMQRHILHYIYGCYYCPWPTPSTKHLEDCMKLADNVQFKKDLPMGFFYIQ